MSAIAQMSGIEDGVQQDWVGGVPTNVVATPPVIRKKIIIAEPKAQAASAVALNEHAAQAAHFSESRRELLERIARTPIVPLAWVRGTMQINPEEAGERKSGRPRLNVRKSLGVADLDSSLLYIQRRTRELQKVIKGSQPDSEHTTKIVTAAIKDAVRKLCSNLPDEKRDAIDEVVAKF